jgi:prevent-host-death family protein
MAQSTISSREFNQDVSRAKREADAGPVVITDRGAPAYVLLSYERYRALVGPRASLRDALVQSDGDEIEFDPPQLGPSNWRVPDLG